MKIAELKAREIYDSRGWPTIQCTIVLADGRSVHASVPTGLSKSLHESHELRDGGKRLWGMGVLKSIETIEKVIAPELIDKEPQSIDLDITLIELDGTPHKSHLGANTLLAVSMALYRAQALVEGLELYELIASVFGAESVTLPFPFFNILNGGAHADNNLPIQEIMIVPVGADSFRHAVEIAVTTFHELKTILHRHGKDIRLGDEGGFAPHCARSEEALDLVCEAIEKTSATYGLNCVIGLDVAASQLIDRTDGLYLFDGQKLTSGEMIQWYQKIINEYPIMAIEDGLDQDDLSGWLSFITALGDRIQIIGDDIYATQHDRIQQLNAQGIAASAIIKPNQVGTVTETLQTLQLCKHLQLPTIVSHRSGETEDTFIADLAVGTSAGQIKAGSCMHSERLAKYNRLLYIEEQLMQNT